MVLLLGNNHTLGRLKNVKPDDLFGLIPGEIHEICRSLLYT